MLNNLKATKENYRKILRAMYEATGNIYWLHKTEFDGQMKENFFTSFYEAKKELTNFVKNGGVFKYNLLCKGLKVPFIYNSIK